ncbi:beta-ketoacyl-ACP synthase III [Aliidiomarina maris]|uniref:Beta-ketoacyl-[acyl-carrier-protein] synthase III n=1 Tax=Aliidiomarina maris TaxID=531312 RepID=A0A327X0Z8_9GAMM|nr:beta-ketoacyl-ACP synthase III [Aliidiomarina maris]MBA3989080.1 3-oxoacyl-ACP synthase [Idiomarina sp.]RAJ98868.1 3-oxoacyl-[acyl-carrier-protein] synthase-3 [Aliidiomarina maris]RUO25015.1 3-oxoacyl-ACP synthase [Aliidiomarina maris]
MHARISGTGHYLPRQRLTNHDLEQRVDTSDQWIRDRTGIAERRIAGADETVVTMSVPAAKAALAAAGLHAQDLDMIVLATTSADKAFPSAACELQHALGVTDIPAFDVGAACAGFMFAMSIADQYIRNRQAKHILVVGADVLARLCNPNDRNTIVLFGDGAGAMVLSASEEPGVHSTHLHSAGEFSELLGAGHVNAFNAAASDDDAWLYMKGSEVFKVAVNKLSELVADTLAHNQVSQAELDWLIPHQANRRIIQATAKKLNMSLEQVVLTLEYTGNTSAASVPIALDVAIRDGRIQRGHKLLLEAFGGGFAWGSALVTY